MISDQNQTSEQQKIETAFEMLANVQNVAQHLSTTPAAPGHIPVREMLRIVTGPKRDDDQTLLTEISANFNARRQFRAILKSQAFATQPQQAAAASAGTATQGRRSGDEFDLNLIRSSKDDGLFYLQLMVKSDVDLSKVTQAETLFAETNERFVSMPLPKIMDGVAQLMIKQGHPILDAFHDPEAEFFIR